MVGHVVVPSLLAVVAISVALFIVMSPVDPANGAEKAASQFIVFSLAVALTVSLGLLLYSWRCSARYVLSLKENASDVGIWVMKTAFGRRNEGDPVLEEFPWARGSPPDPGPASVVVRDWLEKKLADAEEKSRRLDEELTRDMEMAKDFQQALIERPCPDVPAVHVEGRLRLEFHHFYKPTMAVGGDFFDIIPSGNDCAGIFITDVMGHGVRSSLLTAMLRTLISKQQSQARNAPHFMKEINREFATLISTLPTPLFASAFYMLVDCTSRIATYACAGHPAPFQLHRNLSRVSRLPSPKPHGAALGLIADETYPAENVRLQNGQTFIFFTDGVYECTNVNGEEFGLARMERVLQNNIFKSSDEILEAMQRAIEKFTRGVPLEDDLCLLAIDVTTEPKD